MERLIDAQSTVDAEPVRHGKWIKAGRMAGKTVLKCSECSQGITSMFAPDYHYCPNCGCRMDADKGVD